MTLYEFNALELNERMEAVNQYGTFLDNYITKDIGINCYAIDKFFVEVVYNTEHNTLKEERSKRCYIISFRQHLIFSLNND